jgi:tetratricopeptide (TPR) repeat protein
MSKSARLWIFRIVTAIFLPVLALAAIETTLRLVGYGHAATFTVPCTVNGRDSYCDNDHFTWQFFPAGAFRLPLSFAFPAEKPTDSFRIFVVGESAAQGDPEPSYSFSRYLEVMLRERFPAVRFEVVNAGITAVNSHVLLPLVRDLTRHEPDLFVIYTGNNEVVGPFGAGNAFTPSGSSLALIRSGVLVRSTRLGQLLGDALRSQSTQGQWHGMEQFLKQQVSADTPALKNVYGNFEANLRDIVEAAQGSGAHVLLSTVGVNLKDSAPFASAHRADLTDSERQAWEAAVKDGAALEESNQHAEALRRYLAAAAIDARYAELQFRIGRVQHNLSDFTQARERFALARDLDVLRFRADSRINDTIRSVAKASRTGVDLVDAEAIFADESANGLSGRDLFYDHVHMRPRGNYLIARDLFPRVVALLREKVPQSNASVEAPSAEEAEALLAMTPFDRRRVATTVGTWLGQPPFTNQINNRDEVSVLRRQAQEGAIDFESTAAAYRSAIAKAPEDRHLHFNFGMVLEQSEPAAAAAEFRRALGLLPGDYGARQELGDTLIRMGKFEDGIVEYRALLSQKPYHAPAYLSMGYALAQVQKFDESIAAYEKAAHCNPGYTIAAYNTIGLIQASQKKYDEAAVSFQRALYANPAGVATVDILQNLSEALNQAGRTPEAERALATLAEHEANQRRRSAPSDKPNENLEGAQ